MRIQTAIMAVICALWSGLAFGAAKAVIQVPAGYRVEEGWTRVAPDRELWARVYRSNSKLPAVVFLNGLTQDTDHWATTVPEVLETGATVIVYDAFHQGRTLRNFVDKSQVVQQLGQRPLLPPLLMARQIVGDREPLLPAAPIEQQARDLKVLLQKVLGDHQKVVVVGLSYGGALNLEYAAIDPDRVQAVVSIAPYVEPLAEQDQIIKTLIGNYRRMNPFSTASEDDLYDFSLRVLVLSTYHFSEPTILKWGAFQPYANSELARGIRHSDVSKLVQRLPPGVFHLGIAGLDPYIQRQVLDDFWKTVPKSARGTVTYFEGVEHKVNESVGPFLGAWLAQIVMKNKLLNSGRVFSATPENGVVHEVDGPGRLELVAASPCENLLLKPTGPGSANLPVDRIARHPAEIMTQYFLSNLPPAWREMGERFARIWGML